MRYALAFAAFYCVTSPAFAQEKVGVESCDMFLTKYEACMKDKVGAQKGQLDQSVRQMRASWKQMAADPQTRPMLDQSCKQASDTMKASLNAPPHNCGF